jgi:hypothetical protein
MKLVARTRARPAKIKSLVQSRYGAPSRAVVPFALAYDFVELSREQSTNRKAFFGRQYAGLSQNICIELERDIRFHRWHGSACSTILRASAKIRKTMTRGEG